MAFGGGVADAQRLGNRGAPAAGWRGGPPPQGQPMPRPNPGQWQGQRPGNPGGWNGQRPGNPGNWNGQRPGNWNNGGQWRKGWISNRSRWGNRMGGYWWAGVQAPGGWNGYTRIKRGKRIPNYWLSANFMIGDWQLYGLMAPPAGYYWTRYYNDALLVDRYGVVYDGAYGLDWDRYDDGYAYDDSEAYAGGPGYAEPMGPPPAYGAGYPAPGYGDGNGYYEESRDYRAAPLPPPMMAPNMPYRGGYVGTYYTPPGTTTTIVIPGATTTTTTTEYITERYTPRPVIKKVYRAPVRKWRPKPRPCGCGCCR
ncbi:RcnB family protein [Sphingomonas sp.]|uniref:RcnB family protein n=1 Tax=Sphingomonas sp. TaxID=28214 RepID=UPI003F80C6A0